MTDKERQEINRLLKDLKKMRALAELIDDRLFNISMTLWRKTLPKKATG